MSLITDKVKKAAAKIFTSNPKLDKLFVNDKGEFFTTHNYALNSTKNKDSIAELPRASVVTDKEVTADAPAKDARPNVPDTIKLVEAATTPEELAAYEGDERTTVQKAVEKKKKELENIQ